MICYDSKLAWEGDIWDGLLDRWWMEVDTV